MQRPDRDDYITVLWDNIPQSRYRQYKKLSYSDVLTYGVPYDCRSIMHYTAYAGSITAGKPSMVSKVCT